MSNAYELKVELVSHYLNLIRKLIIILIEINQKVFFCYVREILLLLCSCAEVICLLTLINIKNDN